MNYIEHKGTTVTIWMGTSKGILVETKWNKVYFNKYHTLYLSTIFYPYKSSLRLPHPWIDSNIAFCSLNSSPTSFWCHQLYVARVSLIFPFFLTHSLFFISLPCKFILIHSLYMTKIPHIHVASVHSLHCYPVFFIKYNYLGLWCLNFQFCTCYIMQCIEYLL